jgi:anhydro-N-acetylmuramic acid kinase
MFDRDGRWAAQGKVSEKLLAEMMAHPFLKKRPPKTTGREEFGEPFARQVLTSVRRMRLRPADVVATTTAFTVCSIADAYERFVFPKLSRMQRGKLQVVLGGGGAKNRTLRRMLARRLSPAGVIALDDLGIASSAKEALAFALLAHETLAARPGNVPSATGARQAVVLGNITPGV